jgi:IS5 family transposase
MWVRDRLDGLWEDEDFAGWYPRDGRPGLSPAQLATVSVLQSLLGLSDRGAAKAVRCRIDFKYALGLDPGDPGFHHSVLGDFRERLLEDGRADRLLDLALAEDQDERHRDGRPAAAGAPGSQFSGPAARPPGGGPAADPGSELLLGRLRPPALARR